MTTGLEWHKVEACVPAYGTSVLVYGCALEPAVLHRECVRGYVNDKELLSDSWYPGGQTLDKDDLWAHLPTFAEMKALRREQPK